ncbi:aldehyde dehydrogenase family protein [Woodsholea maritima]|uniref:aldehyde dehydrogenase family protein n=1 Tax=Woodsholea maritima TaxID=240237 RepID=UPI000365A522|nr:aldehyde dehydrogenase family protein [Woodsholea maritima]
MTETAISALHAAFARQRAAFAAEPRRTLSQRLKDLFALQTALKKHETAIAEVISADFGHRAPAETQLAEVSFLLADLRHTRRHLARWADTRPVPVEMTLKPGKAYIRREPKGVVGIISPWNYPVQLALAPLIAAIAAGNRVMIKPSELTPKTSAFLKQFLGALFDEDLVSVIEGGADIASAFSALPFDHILFTGSTAVGRKVAESAAKNLTPVTLELGGKSPAVIAPDYDVREAAKTLSWGKFFNAGQTCIAPDYVLVPREKLHVFTEAALAEIRDMWVNSANHADYTAIISERHFDRLNAMVEAARSAGDSVHQVEELAQNTNTRHFAPTLILNPARDSAVMREEIFGPIWPIIAYDSLDDAIAYIRQGDHPLALYAYAKNTDTARQIIRRTQSGGASINVPFLHMSVADLPFGGVGASGYGAYHGEHGFLTFTHQRGVFEAPSWHPLKWIRPPYGRLFKALNWLQSR